MKATQKRPDPKSGSPATTKQNLNNCQIIRFLPVDYNNGKISEKEPYLKVIFYASNRMDNLAPVAKNKTSLWRGVEAIFKMFNRGYDTRKKPSGILKKAQTDDRTKDSDECQESDVLSCALFDLFKICTNEK